MRMYDRVQCLATVEVRADGAVIACRCQKDCRHGWAKRRTKAPYHRADFTAPDGSQVKVMWQGQGIMTPEVIAFRNAWKPKNRHIPGQANWGPDE